MHTDRFEVFGLQGFPTIAVGDDLVEAVASIANGGQELRDGDIVVFASKVVALSEGCRVPLASVTPQAEAIELASQTGKDVRLLQLVIDESKFRWLATPRGPVIAIHKLGYQLTSAGVDRDGPDFAVTLPADPDRSASVLREGIKAAVGVDVAVVVADSDGRADRLGATVLGIGSSGIEPLRVSEHAGKKQEETILDMAAGAAGIILGQRGRGMPVVVLRGVKYVGSDAGVKSIIHQDKKY